MTILLTGCAGFIGSHLLERLLADGHRVIGVDSFNDFYDPKQKRANIAPSLSNKNFSLVEKDIRDLSKSDVPLSFIPLRPSSLVMIHLAARAGVSPSLQDPLLYDSVNVGGTINLLELARKIGVLTFIFGSSSSVYGASVAAPFQEDQECLPISPYGVTKRADELLMYTYTHIYGLRTVCLRFFTVYGPRNRPDMGMFKFTDAIAQGKPIKVNGEKTVRDFTYVDDIVEGIVRSMDQRIQASAFKPFEIINLGGAAPVKVIDLIHEIEKIIGKKAQITLRSLPNSEMKLTSADITKAKSLLGWSPKTPLSQGLEKLWEWYRYQQR